jgi:hypothetical protein
MGVMRKFFIFIFIGTILLSGVNAAWRRTQPTYSFDRSEKINSTRYVRSQWRTVSNPYNYRFSALFKRKDYLLWRTLEPRGSSTEEIESPVSKDFCNYNNSIVGEYLPSLEVKNRCCVCLDGWKCEYSTLAGSTKQHICTPDWEPPDTTGN